MSGQPIYVVAGLGRCGSSMLMQMLVASGMEVTNCAGPFFEDGRVTWLPDNHDWLDEVVGKAIKMLGLQMMPPPVGRDYRWIWLDRDKTEQVKSQHKTAAWMKRKRRPFSIPEARKESLQVIESLGGPLLMLRFEDILADPKAAAERIRSDFWEGLDVDKAAAVVRERSPKCLPHMEEGRHFLEDPAILAERESARLRGLNSVAPPRRCEMTSAAGQQCGFDWGHDGDHTWNAKPAAMPVMIAPVPMFKMTGTCPGCRAVVDQIVPAKMAMHIQNGGALPGQCTQCAHQVVFQKRMIETATAKPAPRIQLAKR